MKIGVGTLVAGIILFFWQFASWAALGVHANEFNFSPNQDKVMAALSESFSEDGTYMLPSLEPGFTAEEDEAFRKALEGKPWARVEYHQSYQVNMPLNMFRGLTINLVAAFLLIWVLLNFKDNNMIKSIMAALAIGAIGYMTFPYQQSIWFEGSTLGYIVDTVVQWGLVGTWLGWWLNR